MRFRGLTLFLSLLTFGAFALGSSHARVKTKDEPWDFFNDPHLWMEDPVVDFKKLPKSGRSKIELYSGHAWSQYRGGFSWRPRTAMDRPRSEDIDYKIYTKEEVLKLPKSELATLSPAEKLSLINCDYEFKLVKEERALNSALMDGAREKVKEKEKTKSKVSSSEIPYGTAGFCHLVAELPIYFQEPTDQEIPGCDGLSIPVSSSDLKAMGMMSLRKTFDSRKHDTLGRQCTNPKEKGSFCAKCAEDALKGSFISEEKKNILRDKIQKYYWSDKKQEQEYVTTHECEDINPGSLDILLGNTVGKGRPVIMDKDQDATIWNRTIRSYTKTELKNPTRRKPHPGAAEGTTVEIPIELELEFITNVDSQVVDSRSKTQPVASTKQKYQYYLEVRENQVTGENEILGGSWISKEHPDLFWMPHDPGAETERLLTGEFEKLKGYLKTRPKEELK